MMKSQNDLSPQLSDNSKPQKTLFQEQWYVMRDLKRPNAKRPAYKILQEEHFEVFTPLKWQMTVKQGRNVREQIPFIRDLLFVHAIKSELDIVVEKDHTLQYRYMKGGGYREPMVVPDKDMHRFILAVNSSDTPVYYSLEEITASMIGHKALIVGGPLNGQEVSLIKMRGTKKKRILVEIPNIIAASVEVSPEFIQLI